MNEYTLSQAAALIGRSSSTLRHQVQKGRLKARLVGKTYVVKERELDRYVRNVRRDDPYDGPMEPGGTSVWSAGAPQ